jgi:hypothetical protein
VKTLKAVVYLRRSAGDDDQYDRRMMGSGVRRDVNAVHVAGHFDVGKQHLGERDLVKRRAA